MVRKLMWWAISGLMALLLVVAACGPPAGETAPTPPTTPTAPTTPTSPVAPTQEKPPQEAMKPTVEMPKYGGVVTLLSSEVAAFEEVFGWHVQTTTMKLTNQKLWEGDWTKGPAGSNEVDWTTNSARWDQNAGRLAESWQFSPEGHVRIQIRPGVHYGLNPQSEASRLVKGREVTAYDVAFALTQYTTQPTSYFYRSVPVLKQTVITAPDKWTVNVEAPPEALWEVGNRFFDFATTDIPPEVVEKYGDMTDWKNSVGSGPFMLADYVSASSWTVVRNPDFWQKDPVGPGKGNQLPYLDSARFLIIPDKSTQQAALRTGKIEQMGGLSWEDAAFMNKTTPQLEKKKYFGGGFRPIAMHTDKPDLPFHDIRVRRALMMATDFQAILDALYGGEGIFITWPIEYDPAYADAYLSLEEAPVSVRELYTYNPEKAKQLLTEAGYPEGFKTKILIGNTADLVDYYSIIKSMWEKVGVELTLDVKEWGAYYGLATRKEYEEMVNALKTPIGGLYNVPWVSAPNPSNASYVNDQRVDEARQRILELAITDIPEAHRMFKELMKYVLDQAWMIPRPQGTVYAFWWPWLKNYHGESSLGYFNANLWLKYAWVDRELKKSMGY